MRKISATSTINHNKRRDDYKACENFPPPVFFHTVVPSLAANVKRKPHTNRNTELQWSKKRKEKKSLLFYGFFIGFRENALK